MAFLFGNDKHSTIHFCTKNIFILITTLALIVLTVVRLDYPFLSYKNPAEISPTYHVKDDSTNFEHRNEKCDISMGEWIPNPEAPYYTNTTCRAIHEHQNCMKYGRPDEEFMKWKWKPDGCDLPVFDPYVFLDIVRGKSMAFVGDSLARNHMQSLICLLSRVENPIDAHFNGSEYLSYNFTIARFWSPFLVKSKEENSDLFNLYLDEFDESWTNYIDKFDYIILSAGQWFRRPAMYYENHQLVGCNYCKIPNVTNFWITYGYERAFRTAFKAINTLGNYKGITFLRTFTPSHFENGEWNEGGNCIRQRPFKRNESILEGMNMDFYMIQLKEFRVAKIEGKKKGSRFRLIDPTRAMLLRPDGHPSKYWRWIPENVNVTELNDCVHWCLPGPIDSWGDFLLHLLKMDPLLDQRDEY
ncbi:protein trichome birefringence-like 19 [Olea europaea var. sylvestris]|uniref:protein trichome birefringence-like 19 n=1 Tax=Olea europaea var. sylvestris TaxID=158386 RepID=UPI000C1D2ADE|nr:protein trichome birefringence-like 19 [Olea europaea var. sylvestris]XP_022844792.1 protein trichome birefringence-like 19 [Olea europaea var. sylvestris]